MSGFKVTKFGGVAPRIAPRLLPVGMAQTAQDCYLKRGRLEPLPSPLTDNTPPLSASGTILSIYKWYTYWFAWLSDVDAAPSAIANDSYERVYYTGDTEPRMTYNPLAVTSGTEYPVGYYTLGIPAPTNAATPAAVLNTGSVAGVTQANPVQITTSAAHGLATGDLVYLDGFSAGPTALNGRQFSVTVVDTTNFTLDNEDGTGYGAWSAGDGGTWTQQYDQGVVTTTTYVYTNVSAVGEEGPPSPASVDVTIGPGQPVDLSGMDAAPTGNYNISTKRIYRLNSSNTGGDYQYVDEIAVATTTYTDTIADSALGETIPSTDWIAPPTGMVGLTVMPNGIMAGYDGNQLCLSEPYEPHAYPTAYRQSTAHNIVALCATQQALVVATEGNPYLLVGSDPGSMTMTKLDIKQACVSKRSMVDMGEFGLYASADGLISASASGVRNMTESLMTKEDWQALKPSSISAYFYDGAYIGFYDNGTTQGGFIFYPRDGESELRFTSVYATAGFNDLLNDDLYLQIGTDIKKWKGDTTNTLSATWKSAEFLTDMPVNMGYAQVDADAYPVTLKVYADGTLKHTETVADGSIFSLPSGYTAKVWEMEVDTSNVVNGIYIAESAEELQRV